MATVVPVSALSQSQEAFAAALEALGQGIVTLAFVRRALAAVLAADAASLPGARRQITEAYEEGRLAAADYETLCADLNDAQGEDLPTESPVDEAAVSFASPRSSRHLEPGAVLCNRYVLEARIGPGGMSKLFRARDRRAAGDRDSRVALKLVDPSMAHYAAALRLLENEAALGRDLVHPNIVRVISFERDGDLAFLTSEWLEGESLAELLTRQSYRPLPAAQVRQILADIGAALSCAHERGITHADVKPGNIFLSRDGSAKLLDFGAAHRAGGPGRTGPQPRTHAYASCEVLEGSRPVPQDDVYALACVAYRMLAGRRAFGHHDALAAEQTGRPAAPVRSLAAGQWQALERALTLRRATRTADVATFLREFDAAATTPDDSGVALPEDADGTRIPESSVPGARRRPAWLTAGAVTAAVAALGFAAWNGLSSGDTARGPAPAPRQAEVATPAVGRTPIVRTASTATTETTTHNVAPLVPPARELSPPSSPQGQPRHSPARERSARTIDNKTSPSASTDSGRRFSSTRVAAATTAGATRKPASQARTAGSTARTPAAAPTGEPAAAASAAVTQAAGGTADTAVPADSDQVALGALKFRRYVEPRLGRRQNEGWVEVRFRVDAEGVPRDIQIVDGSPPGQFDTAAVAAVRRWRFEPYRIGGIAVDRRTGVRLRFQAE